MDTRTKTLVAPEAAAVVARSKSGLVEAVEDITYGSVAGIAGKYIEYPFDTVKVRLQSQPDHKPLRYAGPLDCFKQSLKTDGFLGMYRGITAPALGAAAETSSLFVFESLGREILYQSGIAFREDKLSLANLWLTGAFAGICTSFVLTPIELVKCRIQVPASGAESSGRTLRPMAVFRDILRNEGVLGFWHGQMGTLIREGGGSAAWFGAKETVTAMFYRLRLREATTDLERAACLARPLPLWQQALAGASAGVSYNFLFFPADTIKSRMQTSPVGETGPRRKFWAEARAVWKQSGLRGLYRGCGITCLRSAPSSAFIFIIYDGLKRRIPMQ